MPYQFIHNLYLPLSLPLLSSPLPSYFSFSLISLPSTLSPSLFLRLALPFSFSFPLSLFLPLSLPPSLFLSLPLPTSTFSRDSEGRPQPGCDEGICQNIILNLPDGFVKCVLCLMYRM